MNRGEFERPPLFNNRGWMKTATIFTPKGSERVRVQVWETDDGRPIEVFIQTAKGNTQTDQFLRDMGKNLSRLLQAGVPVHYLSGKLLGEVGPLAGTTNRTDIPTISGIQDLVGRFLIERYVS